MPFSIIRNDITKVKADIIVNSANPKPLIGYGTDTMIYEAAGITELLQERKQIGRIRPGDAKYTHAFNLDAKYIIHTVGPIFKDGNHKEFDILENCYKNSLELAVKLDCQSIAFPLISTGHYGFPRDKALDIALETIETFLENHDMDIILVVYDKTSYVLSKQRRLNIDSYIKDVEVKLYKQSNRIEDSYYVEKIRKMTSDELESSLVDIVDNIEDGFSDYLFHLIDKKGLTDVQVYKKANMDRKLFSKIRSNPEYKPRKKTVLALAISLELNIDETIDLLQRAEYAFSPASKFDIIIRYCIEHKIYNVFDINALLFEYDQPILC